MAEVKDLFGQSKVTEIGSNFRIAWGLPGQAGAINIERDDFVRAISKTEVYSFTQADVSSFQYTKAHGYNTANLIAILYDNEGIQRTTIDIFKVNSVDSWTLNVDNAITGTWKIIIKYII